MRIERWDPADETTAAACYEVHRASHAADEADDPPYSAGTFGLFLLEGFDKTPGEVWFAADDDAGVVGYYRMQLWDLENLDRAFGGPVVHPAARRRGYGRALLRHEAARAAAHGRSVLSGKVVTGSAGEAFAAAAGAKPGLVDVRRMQYLAKIEPGKVAELRQSAARAAAGYSLVNWTGDVPERYLGPLAHVVNAFEDAPRGENVQPATWDADFRNSRTEDRLTIAGADDPPDHRPCLLLGAQRDGRREPKTETQQSDYATHHELLPTGVGNETDATVRNRL